MKKTVFVILLAFLVLFGCNNEEKKKVYKLYGVHYDGIITVEIEGENAVMYGTKEDSSNHDFEARFLVDKLDNRYIMAHEKEPYSPVLEFFKDGTYVLWDNDNGILATSEKDMEIPGE